MGEQSSINLRHQYLNAASNAGGVYAFIIAAVTGVLLSLSLPIPILLFFFLVVVVMLLLVIKPFNVLLVILLGRPLLDLFSSVRLSESLNLLGLVSLSYIVFLLYLIVVRKTLNLVSNYMNWFYVFIFAASLSIIYSYDPINSLVYLMRFLSLCSLFLITYSLIQKKEDALLVVKCTVFSSLVPAFIGFYQFISQSGKQDSEFAHLRIFSTFAHPNMYAFYLLVVFFALIYWYYLEREIYGKSFQKSKIIIALIILSQILLTYTRGAWLGLFLGLILLAFFIRELRKPLFILALIGGVLVAPKIYERLLDLFQPVNKYHLSSWGFRIKHWEALFLDTLNNRLIFGCGLGQSLYAAKQYSAFLLIPHNDYLRVFVETGIVGVSAYLLFIGNLMKKLYDQCRLNNRRELSLVMFCLLSALLLSSFADNLIYSITVVGYLFVMLAVSQRVNTLLACEDTK